MRDDTEHFDSGPLEPPDSDDAGESTRNPRRKTMRRREFINSVRFLTFSCHERLPLFGNSKIRDAFAERLALIRERLRFRLIAWVIMPEHVHLLIVPRPVVGTTESATLLASESTTRDIMWNLKSPFAKHVIARWKRLDAQILSRIKTKSGSFQFWLPGGGFDRNVGDDAIFIQKIRYIHHNPVKRGLVTRAEEWAWSSARWYTGQRENQVPIDFEWGNWKWTPPAEWIAAAIPVDTNRLRREDVDGDMDGGK